MKKKQQSPQQEGLAEATSAFNEMARETEKKVAPLREWPSAPREVPVPVALPSCSMQPQAQQHAAPTPHAGEAYVILTSKQVNVGGMMTHVQRGQIITADAYGLNNIRSLEIQGVELEKLG